MKFDLVLTYWRDGLFRSRDRIESSDIDELQVQFDLLIERIQIKIAQEDNSRYAIAEDDDIPF